MARTTRTRRAIGTPTPNRNLIISSKCDSSYLFNPKSIITDPYHQRSHSSSWRACSLPRRRSNPRSRRLLSFCSSDPRCRPGRVPFIIWELSIGFWGVRPLWGRISLGLPAIRLGRRCLSFVFRLRVGFWVSSVGLICSCGQGHLDLLLVGRKGCKGCLWVLGVIALVVALLDWLGHKG